MAKNVKPIPVAVRCYGCRHAVLYKWDNNPIVAFCNKFKTRDAAMTPRRCDNYKEGKTKPEIIKLTHYR